MRASTEKTIKNMVRIVEEVEELIRIADDKFLKIIAILIASKISTTKNERKISKYIKQLLDTKKIRAPALMIALAGV